MKMRTIAGLVPLMALAFAISNCAHKPWRPGDQFRTWNSGPKRIYRQCAKHDAKGDLVYEHDKDGHEITVQDPSGGSHQKLVYENCPRAPYTPPVETAHEREVNERLDAIETEQFYQGMDQDAYEALHH